MSGSMAVPLLQRWTHRWNPLIIAISFSEDGEIVVEACMALHCSLGGGRRWFRGWDGGFSDNQSGAMHRLAAPIMGTQALDASIPREE